MNDSRNGSCWKGCWLLNRIWDNFRGKWRRIDQFTVICLNSGPKKNRYSIHFGRLSGFGKNHQIPSSNYAARLFGRTRNIHEIYRSCILSKYHWIYFAFVKLKRRCVVKIVFINSSVFIYDFSDHKICAAVCCCFCRCCAVRWPNAKHFQSKTKIYKMN